MRGGSGLAAVEFALLTYGGSACGTRHGQNYFQWLAGFHVTMMPIDREVSLFNFAHAFGLFGDTRRRQQFGHDNADY